MIQYLTRTWSKMRIYYTTVYQEIWVGLAITAYAYYKISYVLLNNIRKQCGPTYVHFHHLSQMPPAEG
uniref:Uncharacterized protein n=1 Tax=Chelydra serpentina TaxID=8475 RepID=A0A8C3XPP6_CHESE